MLNWVETDVFHLQCCQAKLNLYDFTTLLTEASHKDHFIAALLQAMDKRSTAVAHPECSSVKLQQDMAFIDHALSYNTKPPEAEIMGNACDLETGNQQLSCPECSCSTAVNDFPSTELTTAAIVNAPTTAQSRSEGETDAHPKVRPSSWGCFVL